MIEDSDLELLDYYISFVIKNNLQEEFDKYVSDKLEKESNETKN